MQILSVASNKRLQTYQEHPWRTRLARDPQAQLRADRARLLAEKQWALSEQLLAAAQQMLARFQESPPPDLSPVQMIQFLKLGFKLAGSAVREDLQPQNSEAEPSGIPEEMPQTAITEVSSPPQEEPTSEVLENHSEPVTAQAPTDVSPSPAVPTPPDIFPPVRPETAAPAPVPVANTSSPSANAPDAPVQEEAPSTVRGPRPIRRPMPLPGAPWSRPGALQPPRPC